MFLLTLGVILTGFGYGIMQPIIYDKTASHVKPSEAYFRPVPGDGDELYRNHHLSVYPTGNRKSVFQRIRPISLLSLSTIIASCFSIFAFFRHHSETLN